MIGPCIYYGMHIMGLEDLFRCGVRLEFALVLRCIGLKDIGIVYWYTDIGLKYMSTF